MHVWRMGNKAGGSACRLLQFEKTTRLIILNLCYFVKSPKNKTHWYDNELGEEQLYFWYIFSERVAKSTRGTPFPAKECPPARCRFPGWA